LKKILILDLPPALAAALAEQLPAQGFSIARALSDEVFDLIIGGVATEGYPGCPVLRLATDRPLRLGAALRQIAQILAEPVLYLDDIALGPWIFRPQEKILVRQEEGREIDLTDREADMLAYIARHRGRPVSRDDLLKDVWQYQDGVDTHTLETHIYRLRQKAGGQDILVTDAGGGYRLCTAAPAGIS
jgi:hypothetical protein